MILSFPVLNIEYTNRIINVKHIYENIHMITVK